MLFILADLSFDARCGDEWVPGRRNACSVAARSLCGSVLSGPVYVQKAVSFALSPFVAARTKVAAQRYAPARRPALSLPTPCRNDRFVALRTKLRGQLARTRRKRSVAFGSAGVLRRWLLGGALRIALTLAPGFDVNSSQSIGDAAVYSHFALGFPSDAGASQITPNVRICVVKRSGRQSQTAFREASRWTSV